MGGGWGSQGYVDGGWVGGCSVGVIYIPRCVEDVTRGIDCPWSLEIEIYKILDTDYCWLRIVGCLVILKDLLAYLYCDVEENRS